MVDKMILLPLDSSKISLNAVLPAKSLAYLLGLPVAILYVSDEELDREEVMRKTGVKKDDFPRLVIHHKSGNPSRLIVEEAESAAYIVMSTHGMGYDTKKITGSNALYVIEHTDTPVILIKPDLEFNAENHLWEIKRVLIPLNGSIEAAQSLEPAMEIILKTGADVDILHIFTEEAYEKTNGEIMKAPYYEDHANYEWKSWKKEFLKRFCLPFREKIEINFEMKYGNPGDEIVNFALKYQDDLIVLAWSGKLNPPSAATIRKIISKSRCPVLLTKIKP